VGSRNKSRSFNDNSATGKVARARAVKLVRRRGEAVCRRSEDSASAWLTVVGEAVTGL